MLFSILYEAVFVQVDTMLTDREAEETKKAVRDGLNMVMEKSVQFHPPFISSLQVLQSDKIRCHSDGASTNTMVMCFSSIIS